MRKILLAEDDYYIRDIYSMVFSKYPQYELQVVVDGAEAIEKIKSTSYDLILLDIMMPKYTGVDVLKVLRSLPPSVSQTPVYIMTNLSKQDVLDELNKIGIEGYFIKSEVTPLDMMEKIKIFFDQKQIDSPVTS